MLPKRNGYRMLNAEDAELSDTWTCGYQVIDRSARLIKAGEALLAEGNLTDSDTEIMKGAITAAQEAIQKRNGALEMNADKYAGMWFSIAVTSEDIFTISKTADDNLSANSLNTLYGSYDGKATSGLQALFAENDMRNALFAGKGEQLRALKFDGLPDSKATSNIPVFRLPEMYLILAEANAQLGSTQEAIDNLFAVAQRNPNLKKEEIPTAKAELLKFISVERRRELFQEGHRWYDLRRTGEHMTRVGGNVAVIDWDASKFVYPIPTDEVNASGLAQNENWFNNLPKK